MEKYGVEELESNKTAEENTTTCPRCGSKLRDPNETGGILICSQCGSEPFENESA